MQLVIGNKNYSSWSMRPWIVMKAQGIAFEETQIALRQPDTPQQIATFSPSGKVPCLIDGDIVVWETIAILEYLADKFRDKAIWPANVAARAHARAVSAEMHAGFQPLRSQCGMTITQRFKARPRSADVTANVARITAIWNEARSKFADVKAGPFLYGAFTAADGMFAPVVSRFHTYGLEADAVSQDYIAAMRAHPAYQAWVAGAVAEPWTIDQNQDETLIEDLRAKR